MNYDNPMSALLSLQLHSTSSVALLRSLLTGLTCLFLMTFVSSCATTAPATKLIPVTIEKRVGVPDWMTAETPIPVIDYDRNGSFVTGSTADYDALWMCNSDKKRIKEWSKFNTTQTSSESISAWTQ